jgi:ABC-type Zn uptake system ZnuABC Zn-binding protein ZnuA
VILVSDNVTPLTFGDDEHAVDDATGDDDLGHGAFDPHIWHDVTNAIIIVETVRDALVEADPDNAATYEANAAAYIAELETLDAWVMEQVATLPEDQRRLVTSHEALAYYANRYGLELIGTAFGSLSTEAGDPAAADIAALVAEIQAQNVPAIFAENTSNPDLMEAVAAEAGVTLAPTLYTDALGPAGSGVDTYVDLIRTNTEQIVTALSGE